MLTKEQLKKEVQHWFKNSERTAKFNTQLFKKVTEYYNINHDDFVIEHIGWSVPKPLSTHFWSSDFPIDTFEDLHALFDLQKALKIYSVEFESATGYIFQALFSKPGWAKEHNEWLLKEVEKLEDCCIDHYSIKGEGCAVEADCQVLYLQKALKMYALNLPRIPKILLQAISSDERLWPSIDESLLRSENFCYSHSSAGVRKPSARRSLGTYELHKYLSTAFGILNGKPMSKIFQKDYKNALARLLRGDTTLIKPIIHSRFAVVKGVWPEDVVKTIMEQCTHSLTIEITTESSYLALLRDLVLTSPDNVLVEYAIDKCSRFEEFLDTSYRIARNVGEAIGKRVDFDLLMEASPNRCSKLLSLSEKIKFKFLERASVENVRRYLSPRKHVYNDLDLIRNHDSKRFSKIILTGDFVNHKIERERGEVHSGWLADDPDEKATNLERMLCQIPSGNHLHQQALINLVLEKKMPIAAREVLMRRVESFLSYNCLKFTYKCRHYEFNPDHTSDMATALLNVSKRTILNDLRLMFHIAQYLFLKIKAKTATKRDLCPKVLLALCMLTSRCMDSWG